MGLWMLIVPELASYQKASAVGLRSVKADLKTVDSMK
jgi:hypothetical protein